MDDTRSKFLIGLTKLMAQRGEKPAPLSERAGLGTTYIRDLQRGKAASPTLERAEKLAGALGVTLKDIFDAAETSTDAGSISIAGTVGAGAQIPVFDAYEKGDGPQVMCPAGLSPRGVVAVEIEGDSMEPVYSDGDLLFYTRHTHEGVPSEALGRRCVCEDADGMGWVKQVKPGDQPGQFHLISLNPGAQNIWNTGLRWASPVRLHWPAELVRRA